MLVDRWSPFDGISAVERAMRLVNHLRSESSTRGARAPRIAIPLVAVAVVLALVPRSAASAQGLRGSWQSRAAEQPLSAPYQEAIWGKDAKEVRTVRMVVRASGDAIVTVTRRVIDGKGRAVRGTTSIEHATLQLGTAEATSGLRVDLPVTVKAAERRYPDDPAGTWNIEGLRVTVTTFPSAPTRVEVRLDFPDGRGSFWEELRRVRP